MNSVDDCGFTLIETLIALAIMGGIAGGAMMMITNQSKYVYYLEDRLTLANLREEIAQELRVADTCNSTLHGVKLTEEPQSFQVKNKEGQVLFTSDKENQKSQYERLNILNLTFKNIDVPKELGSGWIEVGIHAQRQRQGGGPGSLPPTTFRLRVLTNTHRMIASCDTGRITALDCGAFKNGEIKTLYEGDCPGKKVRKDICVAGLWLLYERKDDPSCSTASF